VRRLLALCSSAVFLAAATLGTGCGEGEVAAGAAVSVYAPASLCDGARASLRQKGWKVDGLKIRLACLPAAEEKGGVDLAAAGANARRATEDTTAVAFIEAPSPAARFTRSIVESAGIAWVEARSGAAAMRGVLRALEERGSSSPRSAVLDEVG
jgi:hypothetical protein